MRRAELVMAMIMAVFSVYLMWKSAELPIGWVVGDGPGGGAFPFWLSLGMLICCVIIIVRWVRGTSPFAVSSEPYMDRRAQISFWLVAGSLTVMIGLIHIVGVYVSIPLFLLFYLRVLGRHRWWVSALVAVGTSVATFLFFEIALTITLPKGATEPLFYPIYDLIY